MDKVCVNVFRNKHSNEFNFIQLCKKMKKKRFKNKIHRTSSKTHELEMVKYFGWPKKMFLFPMPPVLQNGNGVKCVPYSCTSYTFYLQDPKSGQCHGRCINYVSYCLGIKATMTRIVSKGITYASNSKYQLQVNVLKIIYS